MEDTTELFNTPHCPQSTDSLHKKSVEGVWGLSKNVRNIALACWLSVSKGGHSK